MLDEKKFMKEYNLEAQRIIDTNEIPGVAIGLQQHGKDPLYQFFGYRNVEEELAITPDTIFGIASMTKSITCVAIMQLEEAGKLSVEDKVIDCIQAFNLPNTDYTKQVTIHHLMTHTSGLPPLPSNLYTRKRSLENDPSVKDYVLDLTRASGEPIDTVEELIEYIGNLDFKLLGEPGTEFSYSNDGYALLGAIIQHVSGQTYEEYVTEHILQPAGMYNSTFFIEDLEKNDNVTMLYAKNKDGAYAAPIWWNVPATRAAGALKSTVNDILNYTEIYRNGGIVNGTKILTEESVQQMTYPHVNIEPGKFYGYGLRITPDYYGSTLIEHGGGSKGVSSLMAIIPEKNLTGVVLTNLAGMPAEKLLHSALNIAHDKDFNERHRTFNTYIPTKEECQDVVGTYTSEEGMKFTFEVIDEALVYDNNITKQTLRGIGKDTFLDEAGSFIRFIRDSNNNVIKIFTGSRQIFKDSDNV